MVATATMLTRSIQGESLSAATNRLINLAMKNGVIDIADSSYEVLEDTGSNMVITIGSGSAFDRAVVEGDLAGQGIFVAEHQNATQTLSVAASDPTNDRIDRVIVRVYDDTFDSSGDDFSDLEVITGTPDASPAAPAEPSSSYTLATILVQNSVTAITDSDITDLRIEAPTRGQFVERVIFTASGNFIKGDYPWLARVHAIVSGGGGGGGGAPATAGGEGAAGSGGGGSGTATKWFDLADFTTTETVTVGTGGAGGIGVAGTVGVTSSFNGITGVGGGGGAAFGPTSAIDASNGALGGVGTGGDLNFNGQGGASMVAIAIGSLGGTGGAGYWGGGGLGRGGSGNGFGAGDYGGGGGGGALQASQSAATGGAGGNGVIILDLYA